ncbi:MAG: hypothetical protein R3C14_05560 [Caldilineaceae bacterium]
MKQKTKKMGLILLLVCLLVFTATPVFAQELPEPFCGNLSTADCDILIASQEAMLGVESGVYNSEMNLLISGVPGLPADEVSFNLSQDATYSFDPKLVAGLAKVQMMKPEEITANVEDVLDLLVNFYGSLGYDGHMNLVMSQEVADILSAEAQTPIPNDFDVAFRIVDGYGFLDLASLAAFAPDTEGLQGWAGIDLLTLMKMGLQQGLDPNAVNAAGNSMPASLAGFGIGNYLNSPEGRAMMEQFVKVERLRDETIDGQDVAIFRSTFDFGRFVGSPIFRDLVLSQLDTINQAAKTDLTQDQVTEGLTMLSFVGPMLFTGLDFHSAQAIGLDDQYVHQSEFVFDWDLSSLVGVAKMVDSQGEMGLSTMLGDSAPVISFEITSNASDFNSAPAVETPENAQIIPLEALSQ